MEARELACQKKKGTHCGGDGGHFDLENGQVPPSSLPERGRPPFLPVGQSRNVARYFLLLQPSDRPAAAPAAARARAHAALSLATRPKSWPLLLGASRAETSSLLALHLIGGVTCALIQKNAKRKESAGGTHESAEVPNRGTAAFQTESERTDPLAPSRNRNRRSHWSPRV